MNSRQKKKPKYLLLLLLIPILVFIAGQIYVRWPRKELIKNPLWENSIPDDFKNSIENIGLKIISKEEFADYLEATLSGNLHVYLKKDEEIPRQVASLQYILNRSKIEGKLPSIIDLRFDKPVLKY
jgi:hypothetical protein